MKKTVITCSLVVFAVLAGGIIYGMDEKSEPSQRAEVEVETASGRTDGEEIIQPTEQKAPIEQEAETTDSPAELSPEPDVGSSELEPEPTLEPEPKVGPSDNGGISTINL